MMLNMTTVLINKLYGELKQLVVTYIVEVLSLGAVPVLPQGHSPRTLLESYNAEHPCHYYDAGHVIDQSDWHR